MNYNYKSNPEGACLQMLSRTCPLQTTNKKKKKSLNLENQVPIYKPSFPWAPVSQLEPM